MALLGSAACSRAVSARYALAFSLSGSQPRLLEPFEQTSIPVVVTNTGQQAWDPARVHVSYHWLWLVPRELASRSRVLPYQEGIRTELGRRVAPGERTTVEARLLAPRLPGLYWLQWDMVEEDVTWFVQVSPRQPRFLVLIVPVPSLADTASVLPFALALAGLLLLGRLARGGSSSAGWLAYAGTADVVWCVSALLAKPFILYQEARLAPSALAVWLTIAVAVLLPALLLFVLPRAVRAWALVVLGAFGSILVLSDIVYYRFFGDVLSMPALLEAGQTGHVAASIRSLLTPGLVWLVVDLPVAVWLAARLQRGAGLERGTRRAARIAAAGAAAVSMTGLLTLPLVTPAALNSVNLTQVFSARALIDDLGAYGYHVYDAWSYLRASVFRRPATAEQRADAVGWFGARVPLRKGQGPWFGAARGRNLIVVQVESMQDFVVDATVGGQAVMPHLHGWSREALRFTDVSDQTSEGRTSDAEFVSLTSLLPTEHGAVAFRYPSDHPVGLPSVLAEHDYTTLSAVAFEPGFWNRRVVHPAYGFARSLFRRDFTMTERIGWGLNDHDFLQQMVPRLEGLRRPFCAWLITLSLHHPFDDFPSRHKELRLGSLEGTSLGNYLHAMHFFDTALADFTSALARDGLLDDSLIVIFGDHDAGFPHDAPSAAVIGVGGDPIGGAAAWALSDRVPWFVRVPGAVDLSAATGAEARSAGQTDFAPTLAALLGVDPAPLPWMGRNLLGTPGNPPVVRPYGQWLDQGHLFLEDAAAPGGGLCYAIGDHALAPEAACAANEAQARRAREVSRLVIADDLQQEIRTALRRLVQ